MGGWGGATGRGGLCGDRQLTLYGLSKLMYSTLPDKFIISDSFIVRVITFSVCLDSLTE